MDTTDKHHELELPRANAEQQTTASHHLGRLSTQDAIALLPMLVQACATAVGQHPPVELDTGATGNALLRCPYCNQHDENLVVEWSLTLSESQVRAIPNTEEPDARHNRMMVEPSRGDEHVVAHLCRFCRRPVSIPTSIELVQG